MSRRNGNLGMQTESLIPLADARQKLTKAVHVTLNLDMDCSDVLERLRTLFQEHEGNCEVMIHLKNGEEKNTVVRSRSIRVNPSDELLRAVGNLLEPENSWLTAVPHASNGFAVHTPTGS